MNYQETIEYLYSRLPVFQHIGARAFKPGLHTTRELCKSLGDPQKSYPIIHVAGTNGKGSTSHMLAAILQQAGYKVGLYTSPHLKDFRERIRISGKCVPKDFVVSFTGSQLSNIDRLNPSFFELTVAMAFKYFQECQVDVAIVEVGLGGRLDSTNIVEPEVSVITNISLDHTQFLGDTLPQIAGEKAGIIKPGVPVIVSEHQEEVASVFEKAAADNRSLLFVGEKIFKTEMGKMEHGFLHVSCRKYSDPGFRLELQLDLTGSYQRKNLGGVLATIDVLRSKGWNIQAEAIKSALCQVVMLTGLKGRWQLIREKPLVYCDTAHNLAGLTETIRQFTSLPHRRMSFVLGFVNDKDVSAILKLFPVSARYFFCQPSNARALKASDLASRALEYGLVGSVYENVNEALQGAISGADAEDIVYVGGSTFVVADLNDL